MVDTVSFKVSRKDARVIDRIAYRAARVDRRANGPDAMPMHHHAMNITACHANGNPLQLDKLLNADDFNFAHDVFGIDRHINHETGELNNFFSPRCSAHDELAEAHGSKTP